MQHTIDYEPYIRLASRQLAKHGQHNRAQILKDAADDYATTRARMMQLEAEKRGEVEEFNAGYKAREDGISIDNEPGGCKYDVWRIGWVWADYNKAEIR